MLSLRPASTADLALVTELAHIIWPPTFQEILSADQIEYMLNMMYAPAELKKQVEKGAVFMILSDDETPIGYLSYQINYLPATTKIHKLYVLPDQQGKGCGRYMIEAVEKIMQQTKGQSTLRLDVNYQNKALGFYEYLGFKAIDRVDTEIGNGYLMEDYIMEKPVE